MRQLLVTIEWLIVLNLLKNVYKPELNWNLIDGNILSKFKCFKHLCVRNRFNTQQSM